MFGPRSPRYPMLSAYLAARPRTVLPLPKGDNVGILVGIATACGFSLFHTTFLATLLACGVVTPLAVLAHRRLRKPLPPPTPEQMLAADADEVVKRLHPQIAAGRIHRAFHPGVAAVLEECATYHARIAVALEEGRWETRDDLRASALAAAKVAMDEAIVAAGKTLPYAPETRPLDSVSDVLEDIGFGALTRSRPEPMPPGFRPVRDLADGLRELAVRCETAAVERRETDDEPVSAAFRHLDATLGEMRRLEEAERELRQGA